MIKVHSLFVAAVVVLGFTLAINAILTIVHPIKGARPIKGESTYLTVGHHVYFTTNKPLVEMVGQHTNGIELWRITIE